MIGPAGSSKHGHSEPMCKCFGTARSLATLGIAKCDIYIVAPNTPGAYIKRKLNSLSSFYEGEAVSPGLRLYYPNFDHPIRVKAHVFVS